MFLKRNYENVLDADIWLIIGQKGNLVRSRIKIKWYSPVLYDILALGKYIIFYIDTADGECLTV